MKIFEKFNGVFLLAGLFLFVGATVSLGIIPAMMVKDVHPDLGLPKVIPDISKPYYSDVVVYQKALLRGRDIYIKEACWHCHSQYVRPVANEALMYGPVPSPAEYQTVLHKPQLLGTRRVGPDLSRQATVHSNDWHFAHLYEPRSVVPDSVMPSYGWYFEKNDKGEIVPTEDAIALVAYLQALGLDVMSAAVESGFSEPIMPPKLLEDLSEGT